MVRAQSKAETSAKPKVRALPECPETVASDRYWELQRIDDERRKANAIESAEKNRTGN